MSIKINIDNLPGSIEQFSMEQLAQCFCKLNKNNQIITIQIKESQLPTECARILTWNFWSHYGRLSGISDVKNSVIKMILYSKLHVVSKHNKSVKESAKKAKNNIMINKILQNINDLRSKLESINDDDKDDDINEEKIQREILIKEKMILKLEDDDELVSRYLEPNQIGAIGKKVFEILKKGDDSANARKLQLEFEYIINGVRPNVSGKKDQHRFTEGGKTLIYKTDGKWKDKVSKNKSNNKSDDKSSKYQPKAGSYKPPHIRNPESGFNRNPESGPNKTAKPVNKYTPPHLRNQLNGNNKEQKEKEDKYIKQYTGKYTAPSFKSRDNRDNKDSSFISLNDIDKNKNKNDSFSGANLDMFPELGTNSIPVFKQQLLKTKNISKVAVSNIYSNLADISWDNEDNKIDNQKDNEIDNTKNNKSMWSTSFVKILETEQPKKVEIDNKQYTDEEDWGSILESSITKERVSSSSNSKKNSGLVLLSRKTKRVITTNITTSTMHTNLHSVKITQPKISSTSTNFTKSDKYDDFFKNGYDDDDDNYDNYDEYN
jgi:hypothetical protein